MNAQYLQHAPEGAIAFPSDSGWMTGKIFVKCLEHFQKTVNCSKAAPVLLILDNHKSHCSIDAVDFAREQGITMLSIPPHTRLTGSSHLT
jgi:hypothetical protein